jgi:molybdopterin converting factor subunit 1
MSTLEAIIPAEKPASPATVRLLFFGPVRARMGVDALDLKCADEMMPSTLWSLLAEHDPALASLRPTIRLARNGEFLRDDETVRPGDEIALIPPVSGG